MSAAPPSCCTRADALVGSSAYAEGRHFLSRAGAAWLTDHGAALVGIDALNIDDGDDGERPAQMILLAAGIPVVEHLTGLGQLPPTGCPVHRCAVAIEGFGSIPVRLRADTWLTRIAGARIPG